MLTVLEIELFRSQVWTEGPIEILGMKMSSPLATSVRTVSSLTFVSKFLAANFVSLPSSSRIIEEQ